jgi:hypothetical protein
MFDPEVQLPVAGWRKSGPAWTCLRCVNGEPRLPRAVARCLECGGTFGMAHATDEQIEARGWVKAGDAWTCTRCNDAIASEAD